MKNTVTRELIESKIKHESYTTLPGGKSTICELMLENGFSVMGDSSVVDKDNFSNEIGQKLAYQKAFDKVWALEGYLLQQRLYEDKQYK